MLLEGSGDTKALRSWLYGDVSPVPVGVSNYVRDSLPEAYRTDKWINAAARVVHRMSGTPWHTQTEILKETGLSRDELIRLNRGVRESPQLQKLMVEEGLGAKYWNTVLPLVQTGAVDDVLDQTYRFPLRLGVYPGLSCMFYCGFCGRNEEAIYPREVVETGNRMLERIFDEMPKEGTTVSVSGGLEPLTNPEIGSLMRRAKGAGIKWLPVITNGYALTEPFVKKHPGLLEIDSLRISLYGVDEDSYERVTGKRAYERVRRNLIDFIKARNSTGSRTQVGMNYIVLPDSVSNVDRVLDTIVSINRAVDNGSGINFLTMRDDFGSVTEVGGPDEKSRAVDRFMQESERAQLIDIIGRFNDRRKTDCPDLKVDFGYALHSLERGVVGRSLKRLSDGEIRAHAYPQISVVVDMKGDVFLFREAGFLDRPGNDRIIAGRITSDKPLEKILREWVEEGKKIQPPSYTGPLQVLNQASDARFLDSFEVAVTSLLNQAEADRNAGIPFSEGPVLKRSYIDRGINREGKALFSSVHQ